MGASEPELRALMIASLEGDARAYRALLGDVRLRLSSFFARRVGHSEGDAEDLVQETLIAIHTRRETYDRRQPFTPWLFAIARYKLADHFRRVGRRGTLPLDETAFEVAVEGGAAAADARRDVETALAALPERTRGLLKMLKIEGASVAEAAERFEMSEGAVKVATHRALKSLSLRFGRGEPGDD
ncbi:MAG: sigma-70 family RNA polymerase sigma factor [Caulobacteraceae bacterium]|nr:sigma-70 family RNA polymerase sigma factor [Caulobacteraceae bacterium]